MLPLRNLAFFSIIAFAFPCEAFAAPDETNQKLTRCLSRAEQMPDQTVAESEYWIKKGGGDAAWLCHAFAQFHRGEYRVAAQEFSEQAQKRNKSDPKKAASMHAQAGLAAMRAGDHKMAEAEYAAAIKLEPHDPDIWIDRATERAATEHYWDALDDINQALEIMPDMPEALRLRAQIRRKLGQDISAKSDFEYAASIDQAEKEVNSKK